MVWYPAYLEKQEIVDWVRDQRPDLTTGAIYDVETKFADTMVFMALTEEGLSCSYSGTVSGSAVTPADINNFLWAASLCFNLEMLAARNVIHYTHGGLQRTAFGKVAHEFMRMQPMFFIPRGTAGIDEVMPFRSYKQLGQQFIKAFVKAKYDSVSGVRIAIPKLAYDMSSRGYGWNAESGIRSDDDILSSGMT